MILALTLACGSPRHLQYDYSRASAEAFDAQSDLTRESVANELYPLMGIEGLAIRYRAAEAAADKESAESTLDMVD
ncbi:MAG: hypothetical protein GY913_31295 [Proteobacteria bacterium]|nr:hypothetical protein [Pseudomonadota bacterium]MCP4921405.1 hypothetical protein [Pseudomonadota bacterium]